MDSSSVVVDEAHRVKFLCSFGGSILPRPLDGRLRYVGGDTRIVSVSRDITFDELLAKMQELFDGVSVIKYQQPDEDLDALVSVVNDDDVTNMMEEYDKLGTGGDGFTRLRIFLFSQAPEFDAGLVAGHFDADERETERRYVDALNSVPETRSPASPDERYLGALGVDVGMPSCGNLQHLRVGEMEANWNPGYFSPGQCVGHDHREFPHSPSSSRFHFGEFGERVMDDHVRMAAGHQMHHYSHHSPGPVDTMVWLPVGSVVQEQSGFPNNLGHSHNAVEGNVICENCRMAFQRRHGAVSDMRYVDPRWKHGQPYVEQMNIGNDYMPHFQNSCGQCYHNSYMVNQDLAFDHGMYIKEQREFHRAPYNESHIHNQGWSLPNHHVNCRIDETRIHHPGTGRVNEQYIVDGNAVNSPFKHVNIHDVHSFPSQGHEEMHYLRRGNDAGNTNYLSPQTVGSSLYANSSVVDEANQPLTHVDESLYHVPQNLSPIPSLQRHHHVQTRQGTLRDMSGVMTPNGASSSGYSRYAQEGNPRLQSERVNDQISHDMPGQYSFIPQNVLEVQEPAPLDLLQGLRAAADKNFIEVDEHAIADIGEDPNHQNGSSELEQSIKMDLHELKLTEGEGFVEKVDETSNTVAQDDVNVSDETLNFLPELIASAKAAVLQSAEEVIVKAQENPEKELESQSRKEQSHEYRPEQNAYAEVEADFDGDPQLENPSKIEPTTAEDEALANGLQTIKNEDLEEIRELGSGTYGSVFYGKWRGSDVAIKRIKASCFAGKPSERARLIADFWKEALLMSTLHHPNIVSFYGVVRDGPDGSLATVTEFMVNGSLKQFLQKKDRTIDRRKRLIIAMDVAFGMEYLHAKNIVHFDMKCENLLVNMRDPHRPICKIGDLGLSKVKQHTLVSGGIRGTLPWMAPELLSGNNSRVSEKIDVYSFGIVMWELLTGEEPYADMRGATVIGGIINNTLRPKIPAWCDPEWKSLMESCWSSDPALRPSFSEISQILRKMAAAMNLK